MRRGICPPSTLPKTYAAAWQDALDAGNNGHEELLSLLQEIKDKDEDLQPLLLAELAEVNKYRLLDEAQNRRSLW